MADGAKHLNFLPVLRIIFTMLCSLSLFGLDCSTQKRNNQNNILESFSSRHLVFLCKLERPRSEWLKEVRIVNIIFRTGRKLKCFVRIAISSLKEKQSKSPGNEKLLNISSLGYSDDLTLKKAENQAKENTS